MARQRPCLWIPLGILIIITSLVGTSVFYIRGLSQVHEELQSLTTLLAANPNATPTINQLFDGAEIMVQKAGQRQLFPRRKNTRLRYEELGLALNGKTGCSRYTTQNEQYIACYSPAADGSAIVVGRSLSQQQSQTLTSVAITLLINALLLIIAFAGYYQITAPLREKARQKRLQNSLGWEHMSGIALLLSPKQMLLEANPGFRRCFRLDSGKRLQTLLPSDEQVRVTSYLQQAIDSATTVDFECSLTDLDGEESRWAMHARPWKIEGESFLLVTGEDISKRHFMEQELRAEQQRVSAYFNAMQTLLIICDRDGNIVRVNHPVNSLLQMTDGQLKGQPLAYLIPRSAQEGLQQQWQQVLSSTEDYISSEFPVMSASGRESFVSWRMTTVQGNTEDSGAVLLAGLDLTELIANQKALESANVQIREALDQAEQANRSKSVFLANMSHEIRTPMNGILGAAELLLDSSLSEDQRRYLDIIHSSSHVLLDIINDILDLSKIESGKLEMESISFDLNDLLTNVYQLFNEPVRRKGLSLLYYYDGGLPTHWMGDPKRIRQIITNLLSNALKFTDKGRIEIRVSGHLTEEHNYQVSIDVRDSGIGIPADKQAQIFQAFRQADSSTSRRYGGTGLGLTISRHLAQAMRGNITIQSGMGEGSVFTLKLPLPESQQPVSRRSQPKKHELPTLSGHVLLAEDNQVNQKITERMLERIGMTCHTVADGEQAITALIRDEFDLILMDVNMPVMDGITATERIRELSSQKRSVPIIALTANAMLEDRQQCLEAGMNGFVSKPLRTEELAAAIANVLAIQGSSTSP